MPTRIARRTVAVAVVALLALGSGACRSQSGGQSSPGQSSGGRGGGDTRGDLSALQGRWEQLPEEPGTDSPRQRVVKEVSGNGETVTTYGADGKVLHAQTAQFRLSRPGGVPVYTFSDGRITAGPEQGRRVQGPQSYVYKVHGNEFDEVWGLLPGQEEREVVVKRWRRAAQ